MKQLILPVLFVLLVSSIGGQDDPLKRGRRVYLNSCSSCHGISGKGDGVAAYNLFVKPRDFTLGRYKVKSTADGELPLHEDLYTIMGLGMGQRNTMPAWAAMIMSDREAVLQYIKSLYPRFAAEADQPPKIIPLPASAPPLNAETIRRGKKAYDDLECGKCHGAGGGGDGPSTPFLKDERGNKIRPPDLSKPWLFIGGTSRLELYRTINTGIAGSAMPSLHEVVPDEMVWDVVNYIYHEFVFTGEQAPR